MVSDRHSQIANSISASLLRKSLKQLKSNWIQDRLHSDTYIPSDDQIRNVEEHSEEFACFLDILLKAEKRNSMNFREKLVSLNLSSLIEFSLESVGFLFCCCMV